MAMRSSAAILCCCITRRHGNEQKERQTDHAFGSAADHDSESGIYEQGRRTGVDGDIIGDRYL